MRRLVVARSFRAAEAGFLPRELVPGFHCKARQVPCAQPGLRTSLVRKYVRISPIPLIASAPRSSNANASPVSVAERLAHLDAARRSVRFHARGDVHGVAPDVVGKARVADHAGGRRPAMDADAQIELAAAERRVRRVRLQHREREAPDRDRAVAARPSKPAAAM